MDEFVPNYLTAEQIVQIMAQYKQAAEAKALEAWVSYRCNSHDMGLKLRYEEAARDLAFLVSEEKRWLMSPGKER